MADWEATSVSTNDDSSLRELILSGGRELESESRTELAQSMRINSSSVSDPDLPVRQPLSQGPGYGTAKAKALRSPYTAPPIESVPDEQITIPNDANVSGFTSLQLANFLRCLNVEDRIISHLYRKSVDGKRFARMKDTELETLGMNNPVIVYFRNKSNVSKAKVKGPFML